MCYTGQTEQVPGSLWLTGLELQVPANQAFGTPDSFMWVQYVLYNEIYKM